VSKRTPITLPRKASIFLGVTAAAIGCYGAFTFAEKLEGGVSYLAIAAPVVAAAAALIPPLAEADIRRGHWLKAVVWLMALIPAAATVFFASAERVHVAKAGAAAERSAAHSTVVRLKSDLEEAKAEAKAAREKAGKSKREAVLQAADRANGRVEAQEKALALAEGRATSESSLQSPTWLLPVSLDLIAFIAIWSGLSGAKPVPPKPKAKRKRAPRKPPAPKVVQLQKRLKTAVR
jgi:hypothetical protein